MKGHNRTGNLIVPNVNYTKFEDWLAPIYEECLKERIFERNADLIY